MLSLIHIYFFFVSAESTVDRVDFQNNTRILWQTLKSCTVSMQYAIILRSLKCLYIYSLKVFLRFSRPASTLSIIFSAELLRPLSIIVYITHNRNFGLPLEAAFRVSNDWVTGKMYANSNSTVVQNCRKSILCPQCGTCLLYTSRCV